VPATQGSRTTDARRTHDSSDYLVGPAQDPDPTDWVTDVCPLAAAVAAG